MTKSVKENSEVENTLKPFLENLLQEADWAAYLHADPVGIVHEYPTEDQAVVALIVSSLAYGQVKLLRSAARQILDSLGDSPRATIQSADYEEFVERFDGFLYRMTRAEDVADLCCGIKAGLSQHGSLEAVYQQAGESHLERASGFVDFIRANRHRTEVARGLRYLLPSPADGSTTKRLHLFFRWVGRGPDAVDLGLWDIDSSELIMPLDTHTSRICRYLGLTSRKSNDLKTAQAVTASLRDIDPNDPLRFDFAICHLGISGSCIHERSDAHCPGCPLNEVCTLD